MPTNLYGMAYVSLTHRADLGIFVNRLLYEECLYIECISFWHILYKLIESYLKVTAISE